MKSITYGHLAVILFIMLVWFTYYVAIVLEANQHLVLAVVITYIVLMIYAIVMWAIRSDEEEKARKRRATQGKPAKK